MDDVSGSMDLKSPDAENWRKQGIRGIWSSYHGRIYSWICYRRSYWGSHPGLEVLLPLLNLLPPSFSFEDLQVLINHLGAFWYLIHLTDTTASIMEAVSVAIGATALHVI